MERGYYNGTRLGQKRGYLRMEAPLADDSFFLIFIQYVLIIFITISQDRKLRILPVQAHRRFQILQDSTFLHHPSHEEKNRFALCQILFKAMPCQVYPRSIHQTLLFPPDSIVCKDVPVFRILEKNTFRLFHP